MNRLKFVLLHSITCRFDIEYNANSYSIFFVFQNARVRLKYSNLQFQSNFKKRRIANLTSLAFHPKIYTAVMQYKSLLIENKPTVQLLSLTYECLKSIDIYFLLTCNVHSWFIICRFEACIRIVTGSCRRQQTTETFDPLDFLVVHFQLAVPDKIFANPPTWQHRAVVIFDAFRNENGAHYRI